MEGIQALHFFFCFVGSVAGAWCFALHTLFGLCCGTLVLICCYSRDCEIYVEHSRVEGVA